MTPEEEKRIVEQLAEVGLTKFTFYCHGLRCHAITMNNQSMTLNMAMFTINYYGKVSVKMEIIPGACNRVTLHPHGNPDDTIMWFDCDTVEQSTGLQDFITQYNDNWSPDPATEEPQQ